ncbi:MAG TPA: hypothetical protein PLG50_16355 [bacterium]|nr:hypothetical protein [bacterium]HQG47232.1 hypothetical protein [bacterium]HQI48139.1 hypothetical protein [bacterium]HQJ65830.1 hypothetical protein [bacterium]
MHPISFNRYTRGFVLVCQLAGISLAPVPATAETKSLRYWISGGLGICSLGDMAGNLHAGLQNGAILLSMRTTVNSAGLFDDEFYDTALLLGPSVRHSRWQASIAAGVARVTGSRGSGLNIFASGSARKAISPRAGLPLEVQLFYHLNSSLAAGLYGWANLNKVQNWGGIALNLKLGRLR